MLFNAHTACSGAMTCFLFRTAAAMTSEDKKERPVSMICEATNYSLTSDYAAHPMSPVGRVSLYVQIQSTFKSFEVPDSIC